MRCLVYLAVLLFAQSILHAQDEAKPDAEQPTQKSSQKNAEPQNRPPQGRRGGGFGGPIELGPDDKQLYPDPADSIVANGMTSCTASWK